MRRDGHKVDFMEKTFQLEIITPRHVAFKGEVVDFVAPGTDGSFEILKNHTSFVSSIAIGEIRVRRTDGSEIYYATSGGFVEVDKNRVTFLAESCEDVNQIDATRARGAYERALQRLEDRSSYDPEQARNALLRARNRIRVVEKHDLVDKRGHKRD